MVKLRLGVTFDARYIKECSFREMEDLMCRYFFQAKLP
jgi:hypothetical protein